MGKMALTFPQYEVSRNRNPQVGWLTAEMKERHDDILPATLSLYLTGDLEMVIIEVMRVEESGDIGEKVGELSMGFHEAAALGLSLVAQVPSEEDVAKEQSPPDGLIGLRFPPGLIDLEEAYIDKR